jgi:ABC-type transporter Mla MlaB component
MAKRTKPAASTALAALVLPPELTIYTVAELHPQWLAWMAQAAASADEVAAADGAAVCEVDAAGLQMLLSLQRALAERGRRLRIDAPSAALQAGCGAAGLADWLQAPAALEGAT